MAICEYTGTDRQVQTLSDSLDFPEFEKALWSCRTSGLRLTYQPACGGLHENCSCAGLGRTLRVSCATTVPFDFWILHVFVFFARNFVAHIHFINLSIILLFIYLFISSFIFKSIYRDTEREREHVSICICIWYAYVCAISIYIYIQFKIFRKSWFISIHFAADMLTSSELKKYFTSAWYHNRTCFDTALIAEFSEPWLSSVK